MSTRFITTDGVGNELTVRLPAGEGPAPYEVHSVIVDYTSAASPKEPRTIRISLEEPDSTVVAITGGEHHPSGQRKYYQCFYQAPSEGIANADDIQWCPWPQHCLAKAGSLVRVKAVAPPGVNADTIRLRIQYDIRIGDID